MLPGMEALLEETSVLVANLIEALYVAGVLYRVDLVAPKVGGVSPPCFLSIICGVP